jgi:hypothetical protein
VGQADDLIKDQSQWSPDQRDHSRFRPSIGVPGPEDNAKTKYPYRDGIPNAHNASVETVVGLWLLDQVPEITFEPPSLTRVAAKLSDILQGLNPKVLERAGTCSVSIKRADVGNMRWLFAVNCGNGVKLVRMKLVPKGNVAKLTKMSMSLSCSCPAWRWLGSEHHAKQEQYLDGKPVGTASVPIIRDPEGINRVCKHTAATLSFVGGWSLPVRKKK